MSANHTPTPWVLEVVDFGEGRKFVIRQHFKSGEIICSLHGRIDDEEHNATAAFIVRAVNSHEALLQLWRESKCYCVDYVAAKGSCAHCKVRETIAQAEKVRP